MAADALTLEALGVDLDELARRIGIGQAEAHRTDDDCAALAGVTVDRFRAWKDGRERPGVARMPKLAAAVSAPISWLMFSASPLEVTRDENAAAIDVARRAAALLAEAVPHIEALRRVAADITHDGVPVAGGVELASVLRDVAEAFDENAAIPSWRIDPDTVLKSRDTFTAEQRA